MPCSDVRWSDSRFDAEDFIVAFFRQWVHEASGATWDFGAERFGDPDASRRDLFVQGRLEHALATFNYAPGIARKFRQVYVRWERAYRFQQDQVAKGIVNAPKEACMSKPGLTLKQEVNRVLEIVEQVESLSPQSQAYLMALLYQSPASAEALPATRKSVQRAQAKMARRDSHFPQTTEDLEEAASTAQNVGTNHRKPLAAKACCGSRGPRHMATCVRSQNPVGERTVG